MYFGGTADTELATNAPVRTVHQLLDKTKIHPPETITTKELQTNPDYPQRRYSPHQRELFVWNRANWYPLQQTIFLKLFESVSNPRRLLQMMDSSPLSTILVECQNSRKECRWKRNEQLRSQITGIGEPPNINEKN